MKKEAVNTASLLSGNISDKDKETLIKELESQYNKQGIDKLLAEYTVNNLMFFGDPVIKINDYEKA